MKKWMLPTLMLLAVSFFSQAQGVKPKQDIIEMYNAEGKFNKQIVFDYYEKVDEMPEFPGGQAAMEKYIAENLHFPAEAKENKISGKVMLRFIISPTGNFMNMKALEAPAGGNPLIKEAQRLVNRMPRWKPGKLNGKAVYTEVILPIEFKLPE